MVSKILKITQSDKNQNQNSTKSKSPRKIIEFCTSEKMKPQKYAC